MKISSSKLRAFSLIELLSVIAVMAIVGSMVVPAVSNVLSGIKVTQATQRVMDEIEFARSTALARNCPAEVWFLSEGSNFSSMRTALLDGPQTSTWVSRVQRLPDGVGFATSARLSNIIGNQQASAPAAGGEGLRGVALRVYPSGRTELVDEAASGVAPSDPLFLTLGLKRDLEANSQTLPVNFATLQVNPVNGRVVTYRR